MMIFGPNVYYLFRFPLLHRHALGQVAGLVHIAAAP
jgi:hypothetical protein